MDQRKHGRQQRESQEDENGIRPHQGAPYRPSALLWVLHLPALLLRSEVMCNVSLSIVSSIGKRAFFVNPERPAFIFSGRFAVKNIHETR